MLILSRLASHPLLRRGPGASISSRSVFSSSYTCSRREPNFVVVGSHRGPLLNNVPVDRQKHFFSDSSAASLTSILERELNEENEDQTAEIPELLAKLKREVEAEWRIVDGVSPALTKMYKKEASQNGSKIMIEFHCQDTEELDEGQGIDETLEDLSSHSVNFTVTVSRAGKSMVMDCATEESQVVVAGARLEDDDSGDTTSALSKGSDATGYQGPMFRELAEDLQEAFVSYVQEECGVTSDVAAFISMYADYKEQVQYTHWLKAVHSLVK